MHSKSETNDENRVKVDGWPGYVRAGIFVIEKKIAGRKFHVSTRATTLRGAMKQLEAFEANPAGYSPRGGGDPDALVMEEALIDEFHQWHLATVSRQWALNVRNVLDDWANHFAGADLRKLSLVKDLKPHLRQAKQVPHRVKAIRSFFEWLRTEKGLITRAHDVTLDLAIPVGRAAQDGGKRKAVPWEHVAALAPHLRVDVRDVLELMAAVGWHVSEVRRFASSGSIRERNEKDQPEVVGVLGVRHKKGSQHFTALLHEAHLQAAQRIRDRGHVIDNGALRKQMLVAFDKLNAERAKKKLEPVPVFMLGQMRHSVATWLATTTGISLEQVAEYLGHESESTTRKFYVDREVATRVLPRAALRVVGQ